MKERTRTIRQDRIFLKLIVALVAMLGASILSGCGVLPALNLLTPLGNNGSPEVNLPPVFVPEAVRNTALLFIKENFEQIELPGFQDWDAGLFIPREQDEPMTYQFNASGWVAKISFTDSSTDTSIYTVKVQGGERNFSWEGMVNALGQAVTTQVSFDEIVPPATRLHYQDDSFKLALDYPAEWKLSVVSIGGNGTPAGKALRLDKDSLTVVVYYKFKWDENILGGDLPLGDVVELGSVNLLGRSVPRQMVVLDGKEKEIFFGGQFEDLEVYVEGMHSPQVSGDYYSIDLPDSFPAEIDQIIAGLIRTGSPVPVPTATSLPPTPVANSHCDWATFVTDVTIPDGSVIKPGTTFVKTWRLKNRGNCTWNPEYSLVFSSGAQMGGTAVVKLPAYVYPGESVDVSVTLVAPAAPGSYRGYWMLRNSSGVLYGYGENANQAFYVDIRSGDNTQATVSGRICYPSERIPAMNLYLQNMDNNKLSRISILENQASYQVQLEPGNYLAYAWTLNFEIAGGYTYSDHRLKAFQAIAGKTVGSIDICDWYGERGSIPLPSADKYGTISGMLSFPGEQIPPLRIIAFDIYSNAYYSVDTLANQATYAITNLFPGYYHVVAYERKNGLAGGYTEVIACFAPGCEDNHKLKVVYVTPNQTVTNINPADWYAPAGSFPADPTR